MLKSMYLAFFLAFAGVASAQSADNATAKVQRIQGLYLFCDSEPTAPYEYLGTVDNNTGAFKSPQYTTVRDGLIEKLKKEYPNADGVILHLVVGQKDKADAIRFKTSHNDK